MGVPLRVTVRFMVPEDWPTCQEIAPWLSIPELERFSHAKDRGGYVAETLGKKRKIVGFALVTMDRRSLELAQIAVNPDQLRQGVGRALVNSLLQFIASPTSGIKRLVAMVQETDLGALKFLRACGFEAVRVQRDFFGHCDGIQLIARPAAGEVESTPPDNDPS
jgi:ribosomal protein S18 acetylase RimI-like enzyme